MPLNAEQVRAGAKARKTKDVNAAEMGGDVKLRALSAGDIVRMNYKKRQAILEGRDPEELCFEYVALSWVDDNLDLLFPLDDKGNPTEGIAVARSLGELAMDALVSGVLELNGLSAQAVEDVAKN